ncbi:hypothetical protein DXA40_10000 [Blautia sp. OF01-4LB]|nr:hypothetical protein DXA40_10000 [Blautia sp. OF01-4LB]
MSRFILWQRTLPSVFLPVQAGRTRPLRLAAGSEKRYPEKFRPLLDCRGRPKPGLFLFSFHGFFV